MTQTEKPDYVQALEVVYGPPSQAGFGSAVFFQQLDQEADLEESAKEVYQHFVGELWQRWGEETWMAPWQEVYARDSDADHEIVQELKAIDDRAASLSVPMILDPSGDASDPDNVLVAAFDDPQVDELRVYNIGDGNAYSGLILAGQRSGGETIFLVFLLD